MFEGSDHPFKKNLIRVDGQLRNTMATMEIEGSVGTEVAVVKEGRTALT